MGAPAIEPVVTSVKVPSGVLGPDPVSFEVRCFVVASPEGVVLVDTATPGSTGLIDSALSRMRAGWSDVTDIVLTHHHFDHTGGLSEVAERTPRAKLWAGAADAPDIAQRGDLHIRPVTDGQRIGGLRVLATPGHTPGHVSLLHEEASCVLIGDLTGSVDGALSFGPPAFTTDQALNKRSLERVLGLDVKRVLFSHGREVPNAADGIRRLLRVPLTA